MKNAHSANRLRASIVDLTFITWAAAVPLVLQSRLLNADGDFPRHLAMGEFIMRGGLRQIDAFAYTKQAPFLTTEWLSQVFLALAHRAGGLAGVAVLCGLVVGLTYAFVLLLLRRADVDPFLAFAATTAAAVLGSPHWVARPHIFTFLALSILLLLSARPRAWWVWALFFVIWANLHGGFVLGLALLGALAAGQWLEARLTVDGAVRAEWRGRARSSAVAMAIGTVASMFNPQGPGLLLKIQGILSNDYLLGQTSEFQSVDFHSLYGKLVLLVVLGIMTLFTFRTRRMPLPWLLVILMTLAGGLISRRNFPLFALISLPLLALDSDLEWRKLRVPGLERIRRVFADGERIAVLGRWAPGWALLLVLLGLSRGSVAGARLIVADFDPDKFPVAAVRTAREAGLQGRIFSHEVWSGYMLHAWPEQKIFMDGMTDFFGVDLMKSYLRMMQLDAGWAEELDGWGIDVVMLKPYTRLAEALEARCDWRVWYEDQTAVIVVREPPEAGESCQ